MLHILKDHPSQQTLAIAHVDPAGGALHPTLTSHQLQAGAAGNVAPGAAGHRVCFWHREAHRAQDGLFQRLQKLLMCR